MFPVITTGDNKNRNPNYKLDLFILDLMVSCWSQVFYAWGKSTYHRFVHLCRAKRATDTGREMNTIIKSDLIGAVNTSKLIMNK